MGHYGAGLGLISQLQHKADLELVLSNPVTVGATSERTRNVCHLDPPEPPVGLDQEEREIPHAQPLKPLRFK